MSDDSKPSDASDEVRENVRLGDVSDEVREELARLFGTGGGQEVPRATAKADVSAAERDDTRETTAHGLSSGLVATSDAFEAVVVVDPSSSDEAVVDPEGESSADVSPMRSLRRGRRRRTGRDVVPIGDPESDSVAPLPIDPLVVAGPGSGVVQIVDDGTLPEVRDAGEVSRVLIVDDDSPAPRSSERDRRTKRRRGIGRIKWLRLGAIGTGVFVVIAAILASPIFAIRTVVIDGAVYTSDDTLTEVRELLKGSSVFTADTDLARQRMLADPWVAEVRITTDFPGRAVVEVAERVPVVWYAGDDQKARVIDARGHVIAVLEGWPTKYLQVRGTGPSLDAGATADEAYRAAAQLVLALPDEISGKVEALELSAGGELSMFLKGGTTVRFGPPEGLQDKLVAVVVLMRRQDPATLAVVDVSTGEPTVQTR